MLQGCIITGHHTRKPQTQDTLAGFTPAGRPPCPPFPPRCFHFHSVRHSFHYHPQARAYVTVTCSHRDRSSYMRCYFADTRLSLAATPSHLHLHLSRVQLWPSGGACVSVSGTRSISNTKGSELELGLPQRGSEGGDRVSEQRWWDFLSSSLPCWFVFMVTDFHFHDAIDLVIVDHPSFYPLTCSDLLLHPSQIRVCSSVYVCVFAVNGLVLAIWSGLKCANADVNRPGCAQSLLFKPQNNPHQLNAVWMLSVKNVRKAEATFFVLHALFSLQLIDCSPRAAASANLQSAVRYRSVPLGCMLMFSFTLSSPKRWAVGMNYKDVYASLKTMRRPYGAGLHVRGGNEGNYGFIFPRVI